MESTVRKVLDRVRRGAVRGVTADNPTITRGMFFLRERNLSFERKLRWDIFSRPHFAYGMYQAATQAAALGLPGISAIELGVAGGNGLVAMEDIAAEVAHTTGVGVEVYGFDTGTGQPPPRDYRDSPYIWREGMFRIDEPALRARLRHAQLIIGDVGDTTRTFFEDHDPAPIGFIAWDLDYYSSTKRAMPLLDGPHKRFIPRTFSYFDDVVGDDAELHCEWTGELLAIREFNEARSTMKLARISGLAYKRRVPADWHVKTYVLHRFEHPDYCRFLNTKGDWQMPLEG